MFHLLRLNWRNRAGTASTTGAFFAGLFERSGHAPTNLAVEVRRDRRQGVQGLTGYGGHWTVSVQSPIAYSNGIILARRETWPQTTLAVILGNRDFFPDALVGEARRDLEKLLAELDIEPVIRATANSCSMGRHQRQHHGPLETYLGWPTYLHE
jgi:hypothetical protein